LSIKTNKNVCFLTTKKLVFGFGHVGRLEKYWMAKKGDDGKNKEN